MQCKTVRSAVKPRNLYPKPTAYSAPVFYNITYISNNGCRMTAPYIACSLAQCQPSGTSKSETTLRTRYNVCKPFTCSLRCDWYETFSSILNSLIIPNFQTKMNERQMDDDNEQTTMMNERWTHDDDERTTIFRSSFVHLPSRQQIVVLIQIWTGNVSA